MSSKTQAGMEKLRNAGDPTIREQHADVVAGLELLYPDATRISLSIGEKDVNVTVSYPQDSDEGDVKHIISYTKR